MHWRPKKKTRVAAVETVPETETELAASTGIWSGVLRYLTAVESRDLVRVRQILDDLPRWEEGRLRTLFSSCNPLRVEVTRQSVMQQDAQATVEFERVLHCTALGNEQRQDLERLKATLVADPSGGWQLLALRPLF